MNPLSCCHGLKLVNATPIQGITSGRKAFEENLTEALTVANRLKQNIGVVITKSPETVLAIIPFSSEVPTTTGADDAAPSTDDDVPFLAFDSHPR